MRHGPQTGPLLPLTGLAQKTSEASLSPDRDTERLKKKIINEAMNISFDVIQKAPRAGKEFIAAALVSW